MGIIQQKDSMIILAVLDIEAMIWERVERVPYSGPWALADRAASNEAKQAEKTAQGTATMDQSNANADRASLLPFYKQKMGETHAFAPDQLNELLNAAGSASAGTGATAMGEANSEAARTRNTSGFSSALDANARDRNRALGTANLGIGADDITGAKADNAMGAEGLSSLFGSDTNSALKAMGIQNQDINTQIEAGKSGWFQNTMNAISTLTGGKGLAGIPGMPGPK